MRMNRKKIIASILLFTLGAITLGSQLRSMTGGFSVETNVQAVSNVPTYVLYDQLFRLIISFRRKAIKQRINGEPVTSLTEYFKAEAQLTEEQNQKLTDLANQYFEEIEPIDTQASELISQIRESFPDGEIPEGQQVPPPPPELSGLQDQRNALALNYREKLNDAFGKAAFESFDSFMHKKFAQSFQAIGTNPNN